ncbi:MAG: pyruvate ferredoxin oxidoreductase, gamma subunit [Deltaproteobacteria bacterium]|nr:pyruvate ferredoxin oxidoreductase, gamma subunit [Deltaproteobacteria bacterium]
MLEIKFYGRGGQGVVIASQILARAFFLMDMYPQCYSLFGGERRGAPVASFLRVDKEQILLKCEIKRPDHMIYLAPDLIDGNEIRAALKPHGLILINNPFSKETFPELREYNRAIIDAFSIAEEMGLGNTINTAIVGAYCRANENIPMSCLEQAIEETVPAKVEANIEAARRAYEMTQILPKEQEKVAQ